MAKNLILWLIIAAVLVTVMNNFSSPTEASKLNYSEFIQQVQQGAVTEVTVNGYIISGKRADGSKFDTVRPAIEDRGLIKDLLDNNVKIIGEQPERQSIWTQLLVASFPILVIIAVFMFFMRQMQGGGGGKGGPMSFGKSKARLLSEDQVKTTLADVAGCDEAKEEVGELVEFLRDPGKFQRLGGRIPRGVLMVGPPGNVKTLLAKDKIMMGAERKSMVMSDKEKLNTAYHEAGHAIVGRLVPEHDPVYKVSIIPRGRALGVTMFLPEEDRYSLSKRALESQICSLFGGRIAEEMTLGFDGVTTGASNDIMRATQIARNMVTKWGLSEKLGPLMYAEEEGEVFLGRSAGSQHTNVSGETAKLIDQEVRRIIDDSYGRARHLLEENRDKLDMMAEALMKYETIDAEQISDIMEGRPPREPRDWQGGSGSSAAPDAPVEAPQAPIGGPAGEH